MALAKLGSPEIVGRFVLGLAICAPVFMLTNLKLRAAQATDARDEYRFSDYFALRLWGTAAALLIIAGVIASSGYHRQLVYVIGAVALAQAAEAISDVVYGLFQKHERLDKSAISMMIKAVGSVTVLVLTLWATRDLFIGVMALAGWRIVISILYDCPTGISILREFAKPHERFRPLWDLAKLRRLAWLALPLGVVVMLNSFYSNIPRYFVEHYLGEAALGYFAAMAYVLVAGRTVMNALGQAATPHLAKSYVADRRAFCRLLAKLLAMAAALVLDSLASPLVSWHLVSWNAAGDSAPDPPARCRDRES